VFLGGSLEGEGKVCVEKRLTMALVKRLVGKSAKEREGKGAAAGRQLCWEKGFGGG